MLERCLNEQFFAFLRKEDYLRNKISAKPFSFHSPLVRATSTTKRRFYSFYPSLLLSSSSSPSLSCVFLVFPPSPHTTCVVFSILILALLSKPRAVVATSTTKGSFYSPSPAFIRLSLHPSFSPSLLLSLSPSLLLLLLLLCVPSSISPLLLFSSNGRPPSKTSKTHSNPPSSPPPVRDSKFRCPPSPDRSTPKSRPLTFSQQSQYRRHRCPDSLQRDRRHHSPRGLRHLPHSPLLHRLEVISLLLLLLLRPHGLRLHALPLRLFRSRTTAP